MKKLFILIAVVIASATVASAQGKWATGLRIGSGFQAVGQYHLSDKNYAEARFGMSFVGSFTGRIDGQRVRGVPVGPTMTFISADFSALYMWRVLTPSWTSQGEWFLDAGVGLNVGGRANWAYVGPQGSVKLGYTFEQAPVSLAFDWSPAFGASIIYGRDFDGRNRTFAGFNDMGIANLGITCTYNF